MKLLFIYLRRSDFQWEIASSDTYWETVRRLVEDKVVDSARFVIDCYSRRPETREVSDRMTAHKVPRVDDLETDEDEIIWVRGGFKPWIPWLDRQRKARRWLVFYAAGTGRNHWPHWDVVLDDTTTGVWVDGRAPYRGRLWSHWRKLIPAAFGYDPSVERDYDVCINANYVYDRKGQYLAYEACRLLAGRLGRIPRVVMPGCIRGNVGTVGMMREIAERGDVELAGHLPRSRLAPLLNRCKTFVHLGTSTQGDRSPAEAGRCGCRLVLGLTARHSSYIFGCPTPILVTSPHRDPTDGAALLEQAILEDAPSLRSASADYFARESGSGPVGSRYTVSLFEYLRRYPVADRSVLEGYNV